ncbi:YncE family protein [Nocardia australiensis]|uniref:YncE family protein n=1 Tax=Nocardia australiensis TaxID=2887191 RepID=UPI001D15A183|nr:hypothetical protein [Nocardia australiensis]
MRRNRRTPAITLAAALTAASIALLSVGCASSEPDSGPAPTTLGSYSVQGAAGRFDGDIHNNTLAVSPDEKLAVGANSQSGHVRLIALTTGSVLRDLPGYVTPRNAVFAPDGSGFFLSDSSLGVVDHIGVDGTLLDRFPLGAGAFGTAISPDGSRLYVNNQAANTVTVVDLRERRPVAVITGFAQPRQGIVLSPSRNALYVTNFADDSIAVVDTSTNTIVRRIGGFDKIRGVSVTSDGARLFAANSGDNTISIVDTATGATVGRVPVGDQPYGATLAPDGSVLLTGDLASSTVTVVDPGAGTVRTTITGTKRPRQAIAIGRDSTSAWVLNEDLTIAEIDIQAARVVRTLG